ncbi:ICU11, partial [Symbiodinium sp. KB8]
PQSRPLAGVNGSAVEVTWVRRQGIRAGDLLYYSGHSITVRSDGHALVERGMRCRVMAERAFAENYHKVFVEEAGPRGVKADIHAAHLSRTPPPIPVSGKVGDVFYYAGPPRMGRDGAELQPGEQGEVVEQGVLPGSLRLRFANFPELCSVELRHLRPEPPPVLPGSCLLGLCACLRRFSAWLCRLADQFCIVVQFPGGVLCCAMAETEKDADVPVTKTPKETRHCSCNCVSMWEADKKADFDQFFAELRGELGDDDFRNFLITLSGGGPRRIPYHPQKSLHKELFDPQLWRRWIDPCVLSCLSRWHEAGEPRAGLGQVDLSALPGLQVRAPGVVSFPFFTHEFCDLVLEEVHHYQDLGMPGRPPNTMNNYGLVLNDIGLKPVFSSILEHVLLPFGARIFGSEEDRLDELKGEKLCTENWGGSVLDEHHTFVVQYAPNNDKHLDMHIDECDVTFNFGLSAENITGSELAFCGLFYDDDHRKHRFTYQHVKGQCVMHCGKHRHGALDIESGERASLIIWTKSLAFRRTAEYKQKYDVARWNNGPADTICLSYTHDEDYEELIPEHLKFQMRGSAESGADDSHSEGPEESEAEYTWLRVCAADELQEGKGCAVSPLHPDGHEIEIALFRSKGEFFALQNRCSHMGASLASGEVQDMEDLAKGCQHAPAVRCPGHGVCFDLRTGEGISSQWRQQSYATRLSEDGLAIEVRIPGRPGKRPKRSCAAQSNPHAASEKKSLLRQLRQGRGAFNRAPFASERMMESDLTIHGVEVAGRLRNVPGKIDFRSWLQSKGSPVSGLQHELSVVLAVLGRSYAVLGDLGGDDGGLDMIVVDHSPWTVQAPKCHDKKVVNSGSDKFLACPKECPVYADDRGDDVDCNFECVEATPQACTAVNKFEPIPDPKMGICRACIIYGCAECTTDGQDTCARCESGYSLSDKGKCISKNRYYWYALFGLLGLVAVFIVAWVVDICTRPITNADGLKGALDYRSRSKVRMPKIGQEDQGRELWPLDTNLLLQDVAGVGVTLQFNFQLFLILWSLAIAVGWLMLSLSVDDALLILGTRRAKTARQNCILVAWGFETQQRLMWTKI